MTATPNIQPIRNTRAARAPLVEAIMRRRYRPEWLKGHQKEIPEILAEIDRDVQLAIIGLNQLASRRKLKL